MASENSSVSQTGITFCHPLLVKERRNCRFDKEEITNIYDDGKSKTELRRKIQNIFFSDPAFDDSVPTDYLGHEQRYAEELRKAVATLDKLRNDEKLQEFVGEMEGIRMVMGAGIGPALNKDGTPFALNFVMFLPAIMGQGTMEQQAEWMYKAWSGEVIGTYAQTELGHGTYLRGLETTATYDQNTEEFILNSPTLTSTKWWPGGLGKTANHAIVMAQLYTKGECHGIHPFIVQLRDLHTHQSLPGITVGEIGPKLGMNTVDNGFLRMNNIRIPRMNMLMKNSQVLKDGTYIKPENTKLTYGTMVFVRVSICFDSAKKLAMAATIATRYSAVRQQSELIPGEPEPQILDYQTQQYKLIPQIASVFAIQCSAKKVFQIFNDFTEASNQGDLQLLPELHMLSCGLKALCTEDSVYGIDTCRLSCGGHGYLNSSNLPRIFTTAASAITYEGENTVMLLQVARSILKNYLDVESGKGTFGPMLSYLTEHYKHSPMDISNAGLIEGWKISVSNMVKEGSNKLKESINKGLRFELAWNNNAFYLVKCARAHTRYIMCSYFVDFVNELETSEGTRIVFQKLGRLYLIDQVLMNQAIFIKSGALSNKAIDLLESELCSLLGDLRKDAVNLVDSFDIHDRVLASTLGSYDGNVYQRLYDEAQKSPLNQKDVSDAYHKYLSPFIKSQL